MSAPHTPDPAIVPPDRPGPDDRYAADAPWRARLHEIVFEADTPEGRLFDVALIIVITLSVATVMLDSVRSINAVYGGALRAAEWAFTAIFTVEYVLRLLAVRRPLRYALSFYGLVDLLALLPSYVSLVLPAGRYLLVIRVMRLLRIFRVLKLGPFLMEGMALGAALRASRHKIAVFLATVLTLVVLIGTLMYVIEGEAHGFTSIPASMYWTIVTLTTVGYGDLAPQTEVGKLLAGCVMILGFGIIAVPTGIVGAELASAALRRGLPISTQACPSCGVGGHAFDARFCRRCGAAL
ncbi:MAG TPA: ion transporter [Gemmatimonadaceae bacterium]|nr:ion transporter [Gemmatimonadaceae bacterium]